MSVGAATRPISGAVNAAPAGRNFWAFPWEFPQVTTLAIGFIGVGLILQAMNPAARLVLPAAPWSWVLVFGPLGVLALLRAAREDQPLLRALGGIPMAIVSVLAVAALSVPAAIWPQGAEAPAWAHALGLDHLFTSFGFIAALILLLVNLALAVGKRVWPLRWENARFLTIHGGLLLAIGAACAGSSGLVRARMILAEEGAPSSTALVGDELIQLPFAVRLTEFRLESFPPRLALAERNESTGDWKITPGSVLLAEGKRERLGVYTIEVAEYHRRAVVAAGVPRAVEILGCGPAALVTVSDRDGADLGSGWLHAETPYGEELFLRLSDDHVLLMNPPRPRSYESHVEVLDSQKNFFSTVIRVNQPLRTSGWVVYQFSYDDEAGEASTMSVLEAVRDPAYPAIATGFWMVILGSGWFLWGAAVNVRRRENEP